MPLARATEVGRVRWIDDYVRLTLERDVRELGRVEQASALPKLLERLAGQTGQVLNLAKASQSLQISERTAESYLRLLESVFIDCRRGGRRSRRVRPLARRSTSSTRRLRLGC